MVGEEVVGVDDGETVGLEVVGELVGSFVVGWEVGDEVVGVDDGETVGLEVVGELVGSLVVG